MSAKMMGRVWELVLTPPKQTVLLALADHASHDGADVRPGVPLIAWKTGYSERQAQRIMKELEADRLLIPVRKRAGKATIYRLDLSNGVQKKPYIPREDRATHVKMSGVKPVQTPDKMTYVNMAVVTSPENDETPGGDIASANLTSIHIKDQPSVGQEIKEKEEESPAPDFTPVPFHIANGLGRTAPGQNTPLVTAVKAHPVFKAFAAGWDGIDPVVESSTAGIVLNALKALQADIDAGSTTLEEVEAVTRWKRSDPKTKEYRVAFVRGDTPNYRAWNRAQASAPRRAGQPQPELAQDGTRFITGEYADFVQH